MPRLYHYVGPHHISRPASVSPPGVVITSCDDVRRWASETEQDTSRVVATFVVDAAGQLRLADRHSEHCACAGNEPVLAAGEMTFLLGDEIEVETVSNQSTGYCPEPESWPAVVAALRAVGLDAPEGYDPSLVFRRCVRCEWINVVKNGVFVCIGCDAELPAEWNFG